MTQRLRVQGKPISRVPSAMLLCAALGMPLGACTTHQVDRLTADPITWWHDQQGGAIAQPRLPPPGAEGDYPNLASVPARPVLTDPVLRQSIADSLVADRANAERLAAASPLPDPTSPAASPAAFGRATPATAPGAAAGAAAGAAPISASFEAASAPPPPRPVAARQAARAAAPALPVPIPDAPAPDAGLPALPEAAPASPLLRGAATTAMPAPRSIPPARPPVAAAKSPPGPPVAIAFPPGASDVPEAQRQTIRQLSAARGAARIAVIGFGDAAAATPEAQAAALKLGLSRAAAVGRILVADGTPPGVVQLSAEPAGTGAVARLLP